MTKNKLKMLVAALICCFSANAQPCPPNIDFELGFGDWSFYTGTCCPIVATTPTTPLACRHTLTSSTGLVGCTGTATGALDQYGVFPVLDPMGGTQSFRLGDLVNGAQAERARFYVHVPSGVSDYALIYRFAIVFQDPAHDTSDQPRFEINAVDSATGTPVTGAHHTYMPFIGIPGFTVSTCTTCSPTAVGNPTLYRDWSSATIDLSGLGGHTIAVDFMNGDCSLGGHFSYGYFDVSCASFKIGSTATCDTLTELKAPPGYASYGWYDAATFTSSYGTLPSAWVSLTSTPTTFAVILTPYAGFGPTDTLYTALTCPCSAAPPPALAAADITTASSTTPVTLSIPGYFPIPGLTYQWQSSADSATFTDIPGATDITYSFVGLTTSTYYRCEITCSLTGLIEYTPGVKVKYSSVSVSEITYSRNIAIYPNPATDELTVQTEKGAFTSFVITNAVGQQLMQQGLAGAQTKISVKLLPAGVYYVTLKGDQGSEVRKFVKL